MKFTGPAFALLASLAAAAAEAQQPNVAVWGSGAQGQTSIPAVRRFVQARSLGDFYSIGLGNDGAVIMFRQGSNVSFVPPIQVGSGAVQIEVSDLSDIWGMRLADGSLSIETIGSSIAGFTGPQAGNYVDFDLGRQHGIAVTTSGAVHTWGSTQYGVRNVPTGLPAAIRAVGTQSGSAVVLADSTVRTWPNQSAFGHNFVPPAGLGNVVDLAGSFDAFFALKADGTVTAWGAEAVVTALSPTAAVTGLVQLDVGIGAYSPSAFGAIGRKSDGSVVVWGPAAAALQPVLPSHPVAWAAWGSDNATPMCIDTDGTVFPVRNMQAGHYQQGSDRFERVYLDYYYTVAFRPGGRPSIWGDDDNRRFIGDAANAPLLDFDTYNFGASQGVAVTGSGQIRQYGSNMTPPLPGQYRAARACIGAGAGPGVIALRTSGELASWGAAAALAQVPAGAYQQLECAGHYALARDAAGTVVAWGLPISFSTVTSVPSDLGPCADIDVADSQGNRGWAAAIRGNGTIRVWGVVTGGHDPLVNSPPAGTFVDVACGENHGLGLRSDGQVIGWGRNAEGQLNVPAGSYIGVSAGGNTSAGVIASTDCNGNGIADSSEIAANPALDCNGNGRLDSCDDADTAGQPRRWVNAAGGAFQDCSNWSPVAPNNAAAVEFSLLSGYNVSFSANRTTKSLTVSGGTVGFALGTRTYTLAFTPAEAAVIRVGGAGGAQLGVTGGTLTGPYCRVGDAATDTGTLNIGSGGRLIATTDLCVGCAGTGTMNITSGGRVTTSEATIGASIGGSGTVSLSGSLSKWIGNLGIDVRRGTLSIASPASVDVPNVPLVVFQGGTVRGTGTVNGDVANFGDGSDGTCGLEPGAGTAGALVGSLTIAGNYGQIPADPKLGNNSGSLGIDVVGGGSGVSADLVDIQGQASLGGGLFVRIPQGDPGNFANVPILTAGLLDPARPAFDVAYLPALPDGRFMRVNTVGALAGAVISLSTDTLAGILGFGGANSAFVAGQPLAGASGDFDGDGDTDIAVTVAGSTPTSNGALLVLFNDGTGALSGVLQIPLGVDPVAIAAGRLRDNGPIDLVVANRGSDNIQLLFNNGNGVFATGSIVSTGAGSQPNSIALAPIFATFVGQSLDIGVTLGGLNSITVLRNNNGTPIPAQTAPTGPRPGSVGGDDVDNDRDIDFVVANTGNGTATVFKNTTGTFADAGTVNLGVGVRSLAMADLNNDGYADFVTVNDGDATAASSVSVVVNRTAAAAPGTIEFAPAVNVPAGSLPASPAVGDFDADGDLDVAYAGTRTPAAGGQRVVMVLRNDGTSGGVLQISPGEDVATTQSPNIVLAAQMNSDAVTDIVALGQAAAFSSAVPAYSANVLPSSAGAGNCPADLTGDGLVDGADLGTLLSAWGPGTTGDLTGDGLIDGADLGTLLSVWGPCGSQ
jgi:T5SS/PEP-CTERM-associated repeat protein